ncbi:MAG: chemotaxis protein CheD [Candidatus Thorarchaeota archaeon]
MNKEIIVEVSSFYVAGNPTTLMCLGLGSCLGIALYDPKIRIGGLSHAMLPRFKEGKNKTNLAKYVDTSIYLMVDEILDRGGNKKNLWAKLVGGSRMFQSFSEDTLDIGSRNIDAAIDTLKKERIRIKAKRVGGTCGRTITFDLTTGIIQVRTTGKELEDI